MWYLRPRLRQTNFEYFRSINVLDKFLLCFSTFLSIRKANPVFWWTFLYPLIRMGPTVFDLTTFYLVGGSSTPLCHIDIWNTHNGRFQKISVPYHGRLLGIPRATGGSLNWNSEGIGGYLRVEFWKHGGELGLGFTQATDKNLFLESSFLWTF